MNYIILFPILFISHLHGKQIHLNDIINNDILTSKQLIDCLNPNFKNESFSDACKISKYPREIELLITESKVSIETQTKMLPRQLINSELEIVSSMIFHIKVSRSAKNRERVLVTVLIDKNSTILTFISNSQIPSKYHFGNISLISKDSYIDDFRFSCLMENGSISTFRLDYSVNNVVLSLEETIKINSTGIIRKFSAYVSKSIKFYITLNNNNLLQ